MSEMDLFDVLLELGFAECKDYFMDKNIDTKDALRDLTFNDVRNILPTEFVKIFWEKHQNYFFKTNSTASSSLNSLQVQSQESVNRRDSVNNNQALQAETQNNLPVNSSKEHNQSKSNSIFVSENINVRNILDDTFEGRNVLQWYENNHSLTVPRRKKIVHIVMCAVLRQCDRELEESDYLVLRRKIVEVFPKEVAAIYYSPAVSKRKSINGKARKAVGKLLNKYYNLKRLPTGVYRSAEKNHQTDSDEDSPPVTEEVEASVEWLRNLEEPWETAKQNWEKTFLYRHPNIDEKPNKLVSSTFEDWTILKCPLGHELIGIDFRLSGFCKIDRPIENLRPFVSQVSQVRAVPKDDFCTTLKDLLEVEERDIDSQIFIELLLLSFMFASSARIPQGKRQIWKPSCLESFEGIITHTKIYGDIQKIKEEKRMWAASKHVTLQPYIIAVGEEDFTVESTYLIIDDNEYHMKSLSHAIDLCFKSFHVFCAQYPPHSIHLWLLLQHGIYRFRTRWNPHPLTLFVDEILNDIGLPLPPLTSDAA